MLFRYSLLLLLVLAGPDICAVTSSEPEPVEREHFVFYFDNPRYIDMADSVLSQTRERLKELLNDSLSYKPSIYLVENIHHFHSLIRGRFPDWGAAAAFPERQLMAIKSPEKFNINKPLKELLIHEYTHLVVHDMCGFHLLPRWFDEGMAMFVSMEWNWSDNLAMNRAAVFGDLLPLDHITKLNRFGQGKAQVAYAESYLAVKYIYDNYGVRSLSIFLNRIASGGTPRDALMASTGANALEFEQEFHEHLTKRFNILMLFMDTMFFWLALAVLVLVGVFLRYRKRRQYYKKWEEEEKLQSTDFDYGDPGYPEQTDDDGPWRS
ncbi:MAG: peptidase MA family metallohydrolase [candidate division Zixibacteria bacterium]|nr:peptidase MA family metallohydrolase [candidate division Zixibacteria bacterium]